MPVSVVGRSGRAWDGTKPRPFPYSEVFSNGRPVSREEFDKLRDVAGATRA